MAENIAPRSGEFRPKPPRASAAPVCGEGCRVPAATSATCAGDPHVSAPVAYDGVLLLGFGGPEGQDDVIRSCATSRRAAASPTSASKRSPITTVTSAGCRRSTSTTVS